MLSRFISTLAALALLLPAPAMAQAVKVYEGKFGGPVGSASTPSWYVIGDTDTGVFSSGADSLSLTTGGTARLTANTTTVSTAAALNVGTSAAIGTSASIGTNLTMNSASANIAGNTLDGADNGILSIFTSQGFGANRSGSLQLYGNETAQAGRAYLMSGGAGNVILEATGGAIQQFANSSISFATAGVTRGGVGGGGAWSFGETSNAQIHTFNGQRLELNVPTMATPSVGPYMVSVNTPTQAGSLVQIGGYYGTTNRAGYLYMTNGTGSGGNYMWIDSGGIYRTSNSIAAVGTNVGVAIGDQTVSDARMKQDIVDIPYGITELMKLRPKRFRMKNRLDKTEIGLLAQDVQAVIPEVVYESGQIIEEDQQSMLVMQYGNLVAIIIKAVQQVSSKLDQFIAANYWNTFAYHAEDFTASDGDWVVEQGDIEDLAWKTDGRKTMFLSVNLRSTDISSSPAWVALKAPGNVKAARNQGGPVDILNASGDVYSHGHWRVNKGSGNVEFQLADTSATWTPTTPTSKSGVSGTLFFEIQ